jgi:hypothetical protein
VSSNESERGKTERAILSLLAGLLLPAPSLYADQAEDKAVAAVMRLGGRVTDAGVAELQKALPNCKIHR